MLAPGTHGCFVEDADSNDCMDAEDDHSCAGSSEDLQHNLCIKKAEYDCEEPSEEPQVDDDVFESVVGDKKCQLEGTLKLSSALLLIPVLFRSRQCKDYT